MSEDLHEIANGFTFRDVSYHKYDFVLLKAESGPCIIGQIYDIKFAKKARGNGGCILYYAEVGRVNDMLNIYPKSEKLKDEV